MPKSMPAMNFIQVLAVYRRISIAGIDCYSVSSIILQELAKTLLNGLPLATVSSCVSEGIAAKGLALLFVFLKRKVQ